MLSLPLLAPQSDPSTSTFLRQTYRPRSTSPPPHQQGPHSHRDRLRRDEERKAHLSKSPLALLNAAENAIETRKAAVRNFGSHWIRPPGVPKTLQAMEEERQEREEQEELERQERGMLDLQARQQVEEARMAAEEGGQQVDGEGEGGEEERDLDEEIPDADADAEETEDEDAEEGNQTAPTGDVTFNEESMLEGSQIAIAEDDPEAETADHDFDADLEIAELTGAAQDEEDLGIEMERDLDDSVPEAGSYQHTDTELSESDIESELQNSIVSRRNAPRSSARPPSSRRSPMPREPTHVLSLQDRMRAQVSAADSSSSHALPRSPGSLNLSSSMLDSSGMATSSPVVQRSNNGGRPRVGRGGRRGRYS